MRTIRIAILAAVLGLTAPHAALVLAQGLRLHLEGPSIPPAGTESQQPEVGAIPRT